MVLIHASVASYHRLYVHPQQVGNHLPDPVCRPRRLTQPESYQPGKRSSSPYTDIMGAVQGEPAVCLSFCPGDTHPSRGRAQGQPELSHIAQAEAQPCCAWGPTDPSWPGEGGNEFPDRQQCGLALHLAEQDLTFHTALTGALGRPTLCPEGVTRSPLSTRGPKAAVEA